MSNKIIDGKKIADELCVWVKQQAQIFKQQHHIIPGLAVVIVGDDPASQVYVRNKIKRTESAGLNSFEYHYNDNITQDELLRKINELNHDENIHGILVQLPLPQHLDSALIIDNIAPHKDVDGFHTINVGELSTGTGAPLIPCTPHGSLVLLRKILGDLSGKHAVVIGRSNIVGKPMAQLLLRENCTVTIAHSRTENLPTIIQQADIIVAGVGRAEMVKGDWIKQGACVIDVGINRIETNDGKGKLVGDVDYHACSKNAAHITPVPGGVGPMTIAMLLVNSVIACARQNNITEPDLPY